MGMSIIFLFYHHNYFIIIIIINTLILLKKKNFPYQNCSAAVIIRLVVYRIIIEYVSICRFNSMQVHQPYPLRLLLTVP